MGKISADSLTIIENTDDEVITVNIKFPSTYKLKQIKRFLNYLTYGDPDDLKTQSSKTPSKEQKSYDKQLELLENCILLNEEKEEEYQNLAKFRSEFEKFLTKTLREKSELNYHTPEYIQLSNQIYKHEKEKKL